MTLQTQSPRDRPDDVLGQLGNRIQHALRPFASRDQKAVRVAAETFRPNPELDTAEVITRLEVGEALVSTLEPKGAPGIVQRTLMRPPCSRIGPANEDERAAIMAASPFFSRYGQAVDRRSAYEVLSERAAKAADAADRQAKAEAAAKAARPATTSRSSRGQASLGSAATSFARSVGTQIGRELVRGILGSFLKR